MNFSFLHSGNYIIFKEAKKDVGNSRCDSDEDPFYSLLASQKNFKIRLYQLPI